MTSLDHSRVIQLNPSSNGSTPSLFLSSDFLSKKCAIANQWKKNLLSLVAFLKDFLSPHDRMTHRVIVLSMGGRLGLLTRLMLKPLWCTLLFCWTISVLVISWVLQIVIFYFFQVYAKSFGFYRIVFLPYFDERFEWYCSNFAISSVKRNN